MNSDADNYVALQQAQLFEWIPLKRYQQIFPEDSAGAIRKRRAAGHWVEGVHIAARPGMGLWINLKAVKELLESKGGALPPGAAQR